MRIHMVLVFFLAFRGLSLRSSEPCAQGDCDPNNTEANARVLEEDGTGKTPADAELESEVEDGIEAEDAADLQVLAAQPPHHSFKKSFKARESPGVKLAASVFGGVDATPATNKARKILDGPMHLKRIANKDVSRASLSTVQYDWVQLIRGNTSYTVIFECSDESAKVSLPLAVMGLMPMIITVFLSCLIPGFLCGICGKCGFDALEAVPAGPDEKTDDRTSCLVPRLKQSLLVRTTKHWWVQASPALIFAAFFFRDAISSVLFDRHSGAASAATAAMTAVHVAVPLVSCLSSLAVLWGLQAVPGVAFISETAQCPADLQKSLRGEFATVSYFLTPRLGMLTFFWWVMPCYMYRLANLEQCFNPASAVAHFSYLAAGYLLNILASQFLLEAIIVARVAQAHVRTTRDSLDLKPDVDKLQTFHKACVRLVDEIMPELAKISGPTLGLAACRAVLACFFVVLVAGRRPGEIRLTETYLNKVNRGQGLGFVLYGFKTVVDKRMILSIFAKFAAASSLLMTLLRQVYSQEKEMEDMLLKLNSTAQRS